MFGPPPCSPVIFTRPNSMQGSSLPDSNKRHKKRVEGITKKGMADFPHLDWHVFITRFRSLQSGGCGSG
jgi:hypothetical protein